MSPADLVCSELREMGLAAQIVAGNGFVQQTAVVISQEVQTGRFKNQVLTIAVGFQEDSYPEYPPHFIYVADLADSRIPVHSQFHFDGRYWKSFSVPPSDFWDSLPAAEKNMKTFLNRHLMRFWNQI